ncbi:hypothetical protein HK405_001977 [Cladochytrium tenue]|nr:hypothetical protein HK405_001977 [Cladochytrium tenue]
MLATSSVGTSCAQALLPGDVSADIPSAHQAHLFDVDSLAAEIAALNTDLQTTDQQDPIARAASTPPAIPSGASSATPAVIDEPAGVAGSTPRRILTPGNRRRARPSAAWHSVAEKLTCPICLGLMAAPCVISCGHAFCSLCIHQWIVHSYKSRHTAATTSRPPATPSSNPVRCPHCRAAIRQQPSPQSNLAQLLEVTLPLLPTPRPPEADAERLERLATWIATADVLRLEVDMVIRATSHHRTVLSPRRAAPDPDRAHRSRAPGAPRTTTTVL